MDDKFEALIDSLDRLGDQFDVFDSSWYRETTDNIDISLSRISMSIERIANALETIANK